MDSPPSGKMGLMLGEILGRRAGLTRFEPLLLRFFVARTPLPESDLFMPCGPCGDVTALERGLSLVDCELLDAALFRPCFILALACGVCWPFRGSGGGAAASGSLSTSMPHSRAEVAGLVVSPSKTLPGSAGEDVVRFTVCRRIIDAGVAGGRPLGGS